MMFVRTLAFALAISCGAATAQAAQPSYAFRLLQAHNAERRAFGAAPMTWDAGLAAAADAYAYRMAATGRWGHAPAQQRRGQGENLWMGTRGAFSPERMVADWASGKRRFRSGVFPNVSASGNWADVGHYTQIVWPASRRVGCAMRSNYRHDYLVCRYSQPGNVTGQPLFAARRYASR